MLEEKKKMSMPEIGVEIFSFDDGLIKKSEKQIKKSESAANLEPDDQITSNDWIEHTDFENVYRNRIENSTILPQCIESYKNNICGFGIGVRYKSDYNGEETPQMKAEYKRLQDIIKLFTLESDTKKLFEQLVDDAESTGIAYLEIIRDKAGYPVEAENIRPVNSITKSKRQTERVPYTYFCDDGKKFIRKKRFRKYKQVVGGKTVYFKEFGDPRVMDMRNGEYVNSVADLENENYAANEIYEYKFNSKPYGDVRWIGCMYPIVGSSFAEALNLNYFENGRHTPLAICIENGRLSDTAAKKLAEYTQSIKGEKGQHAFLLIETEPIKSDMVWNKENPPKITIKDMANVLQKDELFGEYLDNARRKVQSSFNLPDIYVGYTTDFNRATAYAAMTVTEQQVFQPYRDNLAWDINNKLLNIYNFKYVEAYFETPDFNNPDDIKTVFDAVGPYGGISANFAKEIGYKQLGKDCNDYEFDGADLPYEMSLNNANTISQQLEGQIAKAEHNGDTDIVPILKSLLVEFKKIQHSSGEKDEQ